MAACVPEPGCATAAPARGRPRPDFGPDFGPDPGPEDDPPAGNAVKPRPRPPRGPVAEFCVRRWHPMACESGERAAPGSGYLFTDTVIWIR
jgi:hypothetical protein